MYINKPEDKLTREKKESEDVEYGEGMLEMKDDPGRLYFQAYTLLSKIFIRCQVNLR